MTKFNNQTNTCFPCGMLITNNAFHPKNETSATSNSNSESIGLSSNSLSPESVGVLNGINNSVSYDSLCKEFKSSTKVKLSHGHEKKIVYLTPIDLFYEHLFLDKLKDILLSYYIVYVKIVYFPNLVRMLGKQNILSRYCTQSILDFRVHTAELI